MVGSFKNLSLQALWLISYKNQKGGVYDEHQEHKTYDT